MSPLPRKHFRSPGGVLDVQVLSPRLLITTMSGRLDLHLAKYLLASLDGWVKLGGEGLVAFHDWEHVADYDSNARDHLTPWSRQYRPRFDRVHVLVRSRVVAWGINIVNALTRDVMQVHHARAAFDEARRLGQRGSWSADV